MDGLSPAATKTGTNTNQEARDVAMLTKALMLAALAYSIVCVGMYLLQDRLIFYPDARLVATPRNVGLVYEDVSIRTSDDQAGGPIQVHGWFVPAPEQTSAENRERADQLGTILFLHGNAGNISHRLQTLALLHELGFATLIIDYPGYGQSEGTVGEASAYAGADAAWRYLIEERGLPADSVTVFGRSLGGAMALYLAEGDRTPGALIVESSFTSIPDIAAELYPFLPVRWLARTQFPNRDRIAKVRSPVLVAHGPGDQLIPYQHGVNLYAAAPAPKRFLQLAGGHNDGFLATGPAYRQALAAFVLAAKGAWSWNQADAQGLFHDP